MGTAFGYATKLLAEGVERVFVAGSEIVRGGELTDERPGSVLRSGTDTRTVTVPGTSVAG
jgi:hypothetical protein